MKTQLLVRTAWRPVVAVLALAGALVACGGHSHPAGSAVATPVGGTAGGTAGSTAGAAPGSPAVNGGAGAQAASAVPGGPGVGGAGGAGAAQESVVGYPVGPLLPTVVDSGQCQASQFADKSVYAQISIARATCAQVPSVAAGSDRARGKPYSAAGFGCVSTAQPAGGTYWFSPYFSYNCRNGDEQIAFNWGTSSRY